MKSDKPVIGTQVEKSAHCLLVDGLLELCDGSNLLWVTRTDSKLADDVAQEQQIFIWKAPLFPFQGDSG